LHQSSKTTDISDISLSFTTFLRELLEITKDKLEQIVNLLPATCEISHIELSLVNQYPWICNFSAPLAETTTIALITSHEVFKKEPQLQKLRAQSEDIMIKVLTRYEEQYSFFKNNFFHNASNFERFISEHDKRV